MGSNKTPIGVRYMRLEHENRLIPKVRIKTNKQGKQIKYAINSAKDFFDALQVSLDQGELSHEQWASLDSNKWRKYIKGAFDCQTDVKLVLTSDNPQKVKEMIFVEVKSLTSLFDAKGFSAKWDEGRREFVVS